MPRVEWPTVCIAAATYGGFVSLTWFYQALPLGLAVLAGALILTLHSSLQHETIHGHPTGDRRINRILGCVPLTLWLPYELYRESHLAHHAQSSDELTNPAFDPESHYLKKDFVGSNGAVRLLLLANRTLAGRLVIGPALSIARLWSRETSQILNGDQHHRRIWIRHFAATAFVVTWVVGVCGVPLFAYLIMIYASISLSLIRSFTEHRAHPDPRFRTAVVQAHSFWGWLFLHNNLHVAHHSAPETPWYELPKLWRHMRGQTLLNEDLIFDRGYSEIFRRYLFKPVIELEFPLENRSIEPVKTAA
jgi:fatty acid desaturase